MKHIIKQEQHIRLENTAEHITARYFVRQEYGDQHYLTKLLSKVVRASIYATPEPLYTDFSADEQCCIVFALHKAVMAGENSWYQAQAAHMLDDIS